ncbi:unnamed protein product [Phytophthora fragariaefolia]|uniref:Unnamed protein product n=1 Tax=Phytophthora fragariaefolia TaxID=1490495 RepID=A0A9W6WZ56_9STRA|nr:unnamed protein product [Phytophthora fragariaefolia]
MITRGTNEPAGAPNSPSSKTDTAPSDSELPAAVAAAAQPDVVDVTGSEEAWTRAPARRTSEPAALRASKRAPAKAGSAEAVTKPGKETPSSKRPTAASRSDGGFDLTSFMASFTPGVGTEKRANPEARITSELSASGVNWTRERKIFHDTACFALRPTSPDATTYASPDTQVATIGTSVAYLGGLTLPGRPL